MTDKELNQITQKIHEYHLGIQKLLEDHDAVFVGAWYIKDNKGRAKCSVYESRCISDDLHGAIFNWVDYMKKKFHV